MISTSLLKHKYYFVLPFLALLFASCLNSAEQGQQRDQLLLTLGFTNINDPIATEGDTVNIARLRLLVGETNMRNSGTDTLQIVGNAFQLNHDRSANEVKRIASGTFQSDAIFDILNFEIKQAEESDVGNGNNIDGDAFIEGDSEEERYSMIINGSYNGEDFTFKSTRNFNASFQIQNDSNNQGALLYNLPIRTDIITWFQNPANDELLDPRDADNASIINDNIESSLRLN